MKRLPAALSAIAFVSAGLLTGCSGGDGSDYCNQVRDNAEDDTLDNLDPSVVNDDRDGVLKPVP